MPDIEDAKRHKMTSSGSSKKGNGSPGWVRTAKFVAVMATVLVLLGATDLPGSDSVKRLAAASGLYADAGGAPFPRPERRSLAAQTTSTGKLVEPIRTNERPKLTPEEEKRRQEVIKIYEEAKAEAAKEEKRKIEREAAQAKRQEAARLKRANDLAAEKAEKAAAQKAAARKDLTRADAKAGSDQKRGDAKPARDADNVKAEERKDDSKDNARAQTAEDSAASTADADRKQQKQDA